MAVVNKFNVNNKQVTLDADIIENMSANDVSYNSSLQYNENTVGDKLSELDEKSKSVFDLSYKNAIKINIGDDLNDYKTAGVFISFDSVVSQTLKNIPPDIDSNFKLIVSETIIDQPNKYVVQEIQDARKGRYYVRSCHSGGWLEWYEYTTSKYMGNYTKAVDEKLSKYYKLHTGINIPVNEDLNNYTKAGSYISPSSNNTLTLINIPEGLSTLFKLTVDIVVPGEIIQTIESTRSQPTYVRYLKSGSWTEWKEIDIDKIVANQQNLYKLCSGIKFIDGYAYSDNCIIPTAEQDEESEGTVIISFTTGDDITSTQTIINLSPNKDSTILVIRDGNLNIRIRSTKEFYLTHVTPNTKYIVIFNNKGNVVINDIYKNIEVGLQILNGTVLGVKRTYSKTEPFKGIIHYVCGFDSDFTNLTDNEFKDLAQNIFSEENYYTANKVINNKLVNPYDSNSIAITGQYSLEIKSENFKNDIIKNTSEIENIKEYLNSISGIAGSIRTAGVSSPDYTEAIGDVASIFNHFKLGLVKNGVLQYFVKQNNINWDEQGKFLSILDGEDGDLLVVNDTPIYYLIYPHKDYDLKLFSLVPFVYQGVPCKTLPVRGDAPSFGYIDNVNSSNGSRSPRAVKEALGAGQIHYCRKKENVAHCDYPTMHYIKGRYIPTQDTEGHISYEWDSEAMYVNSGAYRPSVYIDLRSAERAALNKNTDELLYTNKDVLSREILIAMLNAEYKTKNINDPKLFGAGWCSYASATDASQFEDDVTLAKSGIRFKNNAGEWIYSSLGSTPFTKFTSSQFLYCLVSDWYSPWEIMEQHLAVSYAVEHSIPANTWYVYNNFEYKYRNVPGSVGLEDDVMTCVLFKKFRSKLNGETILAETGENLEGNDIEFVISSALYRGWVIDNAPQMWLTGINVVCTNKNVFTYVQHNYKKYIMDKNYGENEEIVRSYSKVLEDEILWDFQKTYELASILPNTSYNINASKTSSKCLMVPQTGGGSLSSYECCSFEPDMVGNREDYTKCEDGEKIITGVKSGYGPFDGSSILNKLYMNHPRTDASARTCYCSFVCQKVEINN